MKEEKTNGKIPNPEQEQAIAVDRINTIVTAPAGSGKTKVMIDRLVRLLSEKKTKVKEILAITFTEAAAQEMKDRLKEKLTEIADTLDEEVAEQIGDIAMADICTIDSFCARLIREYFYVVGVSPDYKIVEQTEADALKMDCLDEVMNGLYERKEEWFLTLSDRYKSGRKDRALKELVAKLYTFINSEAEPQELLTKYKSNYAIENIDVIAKEYKKYVDGELKELFGEGNDTELYQKALDLQFDKGLEVLTQVRDAYLDVLNNDLFNLAKYKAFKFTAFSNVKAIYKDVKDEISAFIKPIKEKILAVAKNVHTREEEIDRAKALYSHNESLVKLVELFTEKYDERKKEENALDFNDLGHKALELLKNDDVKTEIRNKYKFVCADEYQDVNGVQKKLIFEVSDGNVFLVGDPKQSIYRFRGSDANAFTDTEKYLENNGGQVIHLNKNYRSAKAVIDVVNEVFCYAMTKDFAGYDYADKSKLVESGKYPEEFKGRFELHCFEKPIDDRTEAEKKKAREEEKANKKVEVYNIEDNLNKNDVKESKTHKLVAKIIKDEIGKEYYDVKESKKKQVTFGDITILSRAVDSPDVKSLVEDLKKHDIKLATSVEVNVLDFAEVDVLANVLRLVDHFDDDIPLYVTLRSVVGGFTDDELLEITRFYKRNVKKEKEERSYFYQAFFYAKDDASFTLREKLQKFYDYYSDLRFFAGFSGAKKTLEKIIEDFGYEAFVLSSPLGETKFSRVEYFVSLADFGGKKRSVKEFLNFIDENHDSFKKEEFSDDDSVKLMTIHKSKGLEYPVVILYGADKDRNTMDESDSVIKDREYGLATKYFDDVTRTKDETLLRCLLKSRISEQDRREAQRLLYVALTRAKYSLHVVAEYDERKCGKIDRDCFIGSFPPTVRATIHDENEFDFSDEKKKTRNIILTQETEEKISEIRSYLASKYDYQSETDLPLKGSVTGFMKGVSEPDEPPVYKFFVDGETGKERGIIAHKILEYYDFEKGDIYSQAEKLVKDGIITEEEKQLVELDKLDRALLSESMLKVKGKTKYREKSFVMSVPSNLVIDGGSSEEILLQGVIDLLVIDGDDAYIYDYKYSKKSDEALRETYKKQLDLYANAVTKILNKSVKGKILVNIFNGNQIEID